MLQSGCWRGHREYLEQSSEPQVDKYDYFILNISKYNAVKSYSAPFLVSVGFMFSWYLFLK